MTLVRFATLAALAALAAGCSSQPSADRPPPANAPAEQARPAPGVDAAPAPTVDAAPRASDAVPPGFPPACVAYAELIDKLRACDRLGGARAGLAQTYLDLEDAWATVPADRRADVAAQCRTQADSLRNAAAATCGW